MENGEKIMRKELCEKDGILITYTDNDVCFEELESAESNKNSCK